MTTRLVLIHGRAQQHKDAAALKAEWVTAWEEGLRKNDLELPLAADEIRFPYYGDTLWDLVSGEGGGESGEDVADVIIRGEGAETDERAFVEALVAEIKEQTGLTDEQVREALGAEVIERGPLNWEWTQAVLRAVDRFVPGASGASVALFTRDVYRYLTNPGIRDRIESGVLQAMEPGVPTVVVAHSLGTVVAYSLLRREGASRGWNVPLFITVGAPLGVRVIKQRLSPIGHPAVRPGLVQRPRPARRGGSLPADRAHLPGRSSDREQDRREERHPQPARHRRLPVGRGGGAPHRGRPALSEI